MTLEDFRNDFQELVHRLAGDDALTDFLFSFDSAVAAAKREERERIIAYITDPHNNILWIVPGSSHIHAIHADPRVIRAALEPKPEVPHD